MTSALLKKALLGCIIVTALCCAVYFQVFNSRVISDDFHAKARERSAAAEAVRNAAVAQPHKFGIDKADVHTLRITDSVPSTKAGVRYVYLCQEVGGVPIKNTAISSIVKLAPKQSESHSNLRTSSDELNYMTSRDAVRIVPSKQASSLVKNAENCIDTKEPLLSAEEALKKAVNLVLGVNDTNLRRRVLEEADSSGSRRRSVFEAHDGISINDTPCLLSYWSVKDDTVDDSCNIRLCWECTVKPDITTVMQLFIDASEGDILHIIKFGQTDENSKDNISLPQSDPLRRRLSAFSAVPYPNENPLYTLNISKTATLDEADIEPLSLVKDPEYLPSSPNGWLKIGDVIYKTTQGNNVRAAVKVDLGLIDYESSGFAANATDLSLSEFDYSEQNIIPDSFEGAPDTPEAAIVNAFYWVNIAHDILYQYGFDEESGNFQEENFGKGGIEGDSVIVDVRETAMINNAIFLPTIDGENPVLLLFLFVRSSATIVLSIEGKNYTAAPAAFGPSDYNIKGANVIYSNGVECEPVNDKAYNGFIVAIDRGTCFFTVKVLNAQARGAVAVIIIDDVEGPLFSMSGTEATSIPAVSITKEDGEQLKQYLPTSNSVLAVENPGVFIRDSSFDSGIITHEYCHGLSTRLTGGPSNAFCVDPTQAKETGGEGWSDFCSLFMTATNTTGRSRTVGSFASWSLEGIRAFPYSTDLETNPATYSYINIAANASGADATHFVGTIFATVLFDMYWAIIDFEEKEGRLGFNEDKYQSGVGGSNIAMQLVVESLKIQPCLPTFVDSRNAILTADEILYDEKYKCVLWEAFARRGLGESAVGSELGTIDVKEAFDVPPYCLGPWLSLTTFNHTIASGDGDEYIDNCEILKLTVRFKNTGLGDLTNVQLVEVSSNSSAATILNKLPIQLLDFPEKSIGSIDLDFIVDGLTYGEPLELEAKFSASEVTQPILISIVFDGEYVSTDIEMEDSVSWNFGDGDNGFTRVGGSFSLEPTRYSLTIDGVPYYSPVAWFGPQNFSLADLVIQDELGNGCDQVADNKYAGSVVLIERGECDFTDKVLNAQNRGASAVVVINNEKTYPFNMAGENPDITIPAVMVSVSDGEIIKQHIASTLATLSFDASKIEMLSSNFGINQQCNRVRSPKFLLKENSLISLWVNFGIEGISAGSEYYDRANVGLFNGSDYVTIFPDGGEKYNSYGEVEDVGLDSCPAPGVGGWRESSGPTFKKVAFSSPALNATSMFGQMVQLDIALATGLLSYGSFFSIQKIELTNVGILTADDRGSGMCTMPSAVPSHEPSPTTSMPSPFDNIRSGSEPPDPSNATSSKRMNKFIVFLAVAIVGVKTFLE